MHLRKSVVVTSITVLILFASCAGTAPVRSPAATGQPASGQPVTPVTPPPFDPGNITEEEKKATFTDIRVFIQGLNAIIQHKDYDAWLKHLTQGYIDYYSDPSVLAQISDYPILKRMSIKLQSLKDYFIYVVYPSRQNDRVDDIEFVGEQRVKAITVGPTGDRQILYNLEKTADTWKIGIGR